MEQQTEEHEQTRLTQQQAHEHEGGLAAAAVNASK